MLISDEKYFPILIDNIEIPHKTDVFWGLNLEHKDFMLSKLSMFVELTTPVLVMNILGYVVEAPSNWNLLIYSEETSQLDLLEISEISRGQFTAVVYNHVKNRIIPGPISVIDYKAYGKIQTVFLNKNTMVCHPLGADLWVCLSQSDNYNKYLKDTVIGDIF